MTDKRDDADEYLTQEELDELISSTSSDLGTQVFDTHETGVFEPTKTGAIKIDPSDAESEKDEGETDKD
jgi:hypothetical protein